MSEEILRQQLYAAYKNRGMMYYHIFQDLQPWPGDRQEICEIFTRRPGRVEGRFPGGCDRPRKNVPTGNTSL
jgi:hypothetical protein